MSYWIRLGPYFYAWSEQSGQVTQRDGTHMYSVDSLTNRYTQIDAAPMDHGRK